MFITHFLIVRTRKESPLSTQLLDKCVDNNLRLKPDAPYNRLRLYGVDMLESDEYRHEKGGIEFWLGIAKGVGIGYCISPISEVLTTVTGKPYGLKGSKTKGLNLGERVKGDEVFGVFDIIGDIRKVTSRELIKQLGG